MHSIKVFWGFNLWILKLLLAICHWKCKARVFETKSCKFPQVFFQPDNVLWLDFRLDITFMLVIYLLYYSIQVDSAIFFHQQYFGEILCHLPPWGKSWLRHWLSGVSYWLTNLLLKVKDDSFLRKDMSPVVKVDADQSKW